MKNYLNDILSRYDIEIKKSNNGFIVHLKYDRLNNKFINKYFTEGELFYAIRDVWRYIKEIENAGFWIDDDNDWDMNWEASWNVLEGIKIII